MENSYISEELRETRDDQSDDQLYRIIIIKTVVYPRSLLSTLKHNGLNGLYELCHVITINKKHVFYATFVTFETYCILTFWLS